MAGLALAAAALGAPACGGVADSFGDTMEMLAEMAPEPVERHSVTVDVPFDTARAVALEVMEERGFEGLEVETAERRKTYQRRNGEGFHEVVTERVTEREATLEATAGDGRLVMARLREEHGWGRSKLEAVLSSLLSLLGGEDRRSLRRRGVRVTTGGGVALMVHPEENETVFREIRQRLERVAAGGS